MSIKKYLPKEQTRALIQARIDSKLAEKLREKLKREGLELREFFEAAAKMYLDEK